MALLMFQVLLYIASVFVVVVEKYLYPKELPMVNQQLVV